MRREQRNYSTRCILCVPLYSNLCNTVSSQTKDNVLKRRWPFFNRQLIDFLTLDYSIPHCCECRAASSERAREMLAGPAAARAERKLSVRTSLWSCLLLAEKVHTLWGDRAK